MTETQDSGTKDSVREFFKKWPRFYYAIANIFGPVWFTGLSSTEFLRMYAQDGKKVNLGSGARKLADDVTNIDGYAYEGVDLVADITDLPLESDSVSMIVCDNVLEHVLEPAKAVSEMKRILKEGGVAYISTPFLYPFHSSPSDYHRWTAQGLEHLFRDFKMTKIGVRSGMMSGLTVWACYAFARVLSFGSDKRHWFFVNVALFIFFPIKLLDIFMNLFPGGMHTASVLYCVVEKRA